VLLTIESGAADSPTSYDRLSSRHVIVEPLNSCALGFGASREIRVARLDLSPTTAQRAQAVVTLGVAFSLSAGDLATITFP
jgi:hypothetical protein